MKFTLSYEGELKTGGAKAGSKHLRRREFHSQLKRLWQVNPLLSNWHLPVDQHRGAPAQDVLRQKHAKVGSFEFVPLITKDLSVETALTFRILRPSDFKGAKADPDNIIKILVDSLKMPQDSGELPPEAAPADDEVPFFTLMQDDGLVSKIASVTDELLQPILGKSSIERSDTHVLVDVHIRPNLPTDANLIFFSDDFEVWNHLWAGGSFDTIRGWSNAELRARTTQCVLRMRVIAQNFRMQVRGPLHSAAGSFNEQTMNLIAGLEEQQAIWNDGFRPEAFALLEELRRRVPGEPRLQHNYRIIAIEDGMLAGVDPIRDAAIELERLARLLP